MVLNIPLDLDEQSLADKKGFDRVTVEIFDAVDRRMARRDADRHKESPDTKPGQGTKRPALSIGAAACR